MTLTDAVEAKVFFARIARGRQPGCRSRSRVPGQPPAPTPLPFNGILEGAAGGGAHVRSVEHERVRVHVEAQRAVRPLDGQSYLELMMKLESYGNGLDPDQLLIHMPGHIEASIKKTPGCHIGAGILRSLR